MNKKGISWLTAIIFSILILGILVLFGEGSKIDIDQEIAKVNEKIDYVQAQIDEMKNATEQLDGKYIKKYIEVNG
jgi:cell division protein FtsL